MKIATSILNSKDRIKCVQELNRTPIDFIHIDVMDGKFVDNKSFNTINEISAINIISNKKLDIHLMVDNPKEYIKELSNMNIEYITFHAEISKKIDPIINQIKKLGYKVGIAISPNTKSDILKPYLEQVDLILIMSVEPGKGGQKYLNSTKEKIKEVKELIKNSKRKIIIEVDGGINNLTITKIKGASIAVIGSYITNSDNYYKKISIIKNILNPPKKLKDKISINTQVKIIFACSILIILIKLLVEYFTK